MPKPPEENPSSGTGQIRTAGPHKRRSKTGAESESESVVKSKDEDMKSEYGEKRGSQVQLNSHRQRDGVRYEPQNRVPWGQLLILKARVATLKFRDRTTAGRTVAGAATMPPERHGSRRTVGQGRERPRGGRRACGPLGSGPRSDSGAFLLSSALALQFNSIAPSLSPGLTSLFCFLIVFKK